MNLSKNSNTIVCQLKNKGIKSQYRGYKYNTYLNNAFLNKKIKLS